MKDDSKHLWLSLDQKIDQKEQVLGRYTAQAYYDDPASLAFITSRYKFCAKILAGAESVIEVGCGDGFGSALVAQRVNRVICTDINEDLLGNNRARMAQFKNIEYLYHDFRKAPFAERVSGVYLVDVLEHIFGQEEHAFIENICKSLDINGVCLIGTPNKTADQYASPLSREGHVNLKSHDDLDRIGSKFFHNHFLFGMNDEVVHTGYPAMAHFLWLLGVGPRT